MNGQDNSDGSARTVGSAKTLGSNGDQIEFLAPNEAAFGMADLADFVGFDTAEQPMFGDEGPRSRWLPAAAAVALAALLGGGVIAAAPWNTADSGAPAPSSTIAPSATAVATTDDSPSTTDRVLGIDRAGPPGYVLNDAGTFRLAGAWTAGVEFRPSQAYADDWFDLWTSPGATRTTGTWLAITTTKGLSGYDETLPNGNRVVVGHDNGVLSVTPDGVSRLVFDPADGTQFEMGGYGFDLAELLTVAALVRVLPDDTIDYGSLGDGVLAGLTPTVAAHIPTGGLNPFQLMAQRQGGVYYVDPDAGGSVELTVSRPTDVDAAVIDFLLRPVTLTADEQARLDALTRDGRRFRLSVMPDWPGTIVATSMQPGDELMLDTIGVQAGDSLTVWGTNVSVSTMLDMLSQVRMATDDEWVDAIDRSNRGLLNVGASAGSPSAVIGTLDPSAPDDEWYYSEMTAEPSYLYVSTRNSGWNGPMGDLPSVPTVHRYASASVTFLVATAARDSPVRHMRITLDGMPPVDIPLVPVGETILAAGYAFDEMLADTVEFLDDSGNLVPV